MKTVSDSCKYSHLSPHGLRIEIHPCLLCNNSSQERFSLLQMWEATLLFFLCPVNAFVTSSPPHQLLYSSAQTEEPQSCRSAANSVRLSVCESLAPRRCGLSKHTNCSKDALAVLSVCTEGFWKRDHIRSGSLQHGCKLVLITLSTQKPVEFRESTLSVFSLHHRPGKAAV